MANKRNSVVRTSYSIPICASLLFSTLLTPGVVSAQRALDRAQSNLETFTNETPVATTDISSVIGSVAGILSSLAGTFFFILMVYAGIRWMSARGEESQIEDARRTVVAAIIGLVVTASAYGISLFITTSILTSGGSTPGQAPGSVMGEDGEIESIGCCLVQVKQDDNNILTVARWTGFPELELDCLNYTPAPGTIFGPAPNNPEWIPGLDASQCSRMAADKATKAGAESDDRADPRI